MSLTALLINPTLAILTPSGSGSEVLATLNINTSPVTVTSTVLPSVMTNFLQQRIRELISADPTLNSAAGVGAGGMLRKMLMVGALGDTSSSPALSGSAGVYDVSVTLASVRGYVGIAPSVGQPFVFTDSAAGGASEGAWHNVGALGEPAFTDGWDSNPSFTPVAFSSDGSRVWIKGVPFSGNGQNIFTLPLAYRPQTDQLFPVVKASEGILPDAITVAASGVVSLSGDYSGAVVALGTISYRILD